MGDRYRAADRSPETDNETPISRRPTLLRSRRAPSPRLEEVGKVIGRSKTANLIVLEERLGQLRLPELDRERSIKFGKERALEGAGPVTGGI